MVEQSIEFTHKIWLQLKRDGYTHIYRRGIFNQEDDNDNDYILVPMKSDDPRVLFEDTDLIIQNINSMDITDMLWGDPFIRFCVVQNRI